jgi:hypothetical protein
MPGSAERMKGVRRRQHWIVVMFWGVVTKAGIVRYVVLDARVDERRHVKNRGKSGRCMVRISMRKDDVSSLETQSFL